MGEDERVRGSLGNQTSHSSRHTEPLRPLKKGYFEPSIRYRNRVQAAHDSSQNDQMAAPEMPCMVGAISTGAPKRRRASEIVARIK
ncbi:hypothetical protein EJ04DRAFT_128389 [Polyplosphaeria fusca]|uniref:Uncharacterized protein n=1 Tax=Polyplosphaeria fusca TaxID=682080 RepID=A0A9P4UV28_9PLEO|nr:hypothetical protein EJ04DRAFT_128389 [Polyplosphaeria fusca]